MAATTNTTAGKSTSTSSIPTAVSTSDKKSTGLNAAVLLKADHRKVEGLFAQYKNAGSSEEKTRLAHQICKELIVHTKLEEEIFYPACREKDVEDDMLDEAQVEHDGAKTLIAELIDGSPDDEFYDAKVNVLSEYIKHHVGEEEKPRTGILAKAQKAGVDMAGLGQQLQSRKQELVANTDENRLRPPKPRSLHLENLQQNRDQEEYRMPRQSNYRERDERGRFTDDDDRRGGYRGRSSGRERDEEGRFMSDGNGGGSRGGYSSRSRYDDDDDRRSSRGRGHGGWFGDPEGHSEASREGWEGRSSSRGGYSSRSRDYDDDDDRGGRSSRGHGGWFGDPEGHSEAAREGWEGRSSSRSSRSRYDDDDDDRGSRSRGRGHGGWFGDPEGHSEAAREGWEGRSSSRSSRSRYDDDDDRSSRGRGHGGWFDDERGHAQAARRGWEGR